MVRLASPSARPRATCLRWRTSGDREDRVGEQDHHEHAGRLTGAEIAMSITNRSDSPMTARIAERRRRGRPGRRSASAVVARAADRRPSARFCHAPSAAATATDATPPTRNPCGRYPLPEAGRPAIPNHPSAPRRRRRPSRHICEQRTETFDRSARAARGTAAAGRPRGRVRRRTARRRDAARATRARTGAGPQPGQSRHPTATVVPRAPPRRDPRAGRRRGGRPRRRVRLRPGQQQGLRLHGRDDPGPAGHARSRTARRRRSGQVQPDMGRNHILPPESQRYADCPPASGNHYAPPGGPIIARYYGPDDATLPQGWIHNLEHGGLVILYSCDQGACDDATQQALQDLFQDFPDSPRLRRPEGQDRTGHHPVRGHEGADRGVAVGPGPVPGQARHRPDPRLLQRPRPSSTTPSRNALDRRRHRHPAPVAERGAAERVAGSERRPLDGARALRRAPPRRARPARRPRPARPDRSRRMRLYAYVDRAGLRPLRGVVVDGRAA